jgi:hypothetical protein
MVMPGAIVEVRCPNCHSPAVDREHGIGRLIAGILCFVGIVHSLLCVHDLAVQPAAPSYEVPAVPNDVHTCCAARELSALHRRQHGSRRGTRDHSIADTFAGCGAVWCL